jgi:hypothetical protein
MVKREKKCGTDVKTTSSWKPAMAPAVALIVVGIVPGLLKGLYETYTETLMAAYVTFGLSFISLVLGGLAFMALRDISGRKMTIFRLGPSGQPAREEAELVRVKSREDGTE